MKWPKKKRYIVLAVLCTIFCAGVIRVGINIATVGIDPILEVLRQNEVLEDYYPEGYPVSREELDKRTAMPDGTRNAAPLVDQALVLLDWEVIDEHCVPIVGNCDVRSIVIPLDDDIVENMRIVLEANSESLALLHEAKDYEVYERDRSRDWTEVIPTDLYAALRHMSRLLYVEALYRDETGDQTAAMDAVEASYSLTRLFYQEPETIAWLVAHALNGMADGVLSVIIQRGSLGDEELIRAANLAEQSKSAGDQQYDGIDKSEKLVQVYSRTHMWKDMMILGIQIERYRIANGKLPENINVLIPAYIKAVPLSPFSDQQLQYEQIEDGFWIGSHGTTKWDTHLYDVEGDGANNTGQPYVRTFSE